MHAPFRPRLVLTLLLAAASAGCSSVKTISGAGVADTAKVRPPNAIWIRPFATDDGMWQGPVGEPERRAEVRDWLSANLLRQLTGIAPTHMLEGTDEPASGWLVTGRFLRVNSGSRVQRLVLGGLGAGASRLETRVDVFDLAVSSREPLLSFTTTGGSNHAGGIEGALNSTEADVERTAREIQEYLQDHLWAEVDGPGDGVRPAAIDEVRIAPATPGGP